MASSDVHDMKYY
jgi:solute carrier family 25 phosphate transporter 3